MKKVLSILSMLLFCSTMWALELPHIFCDNMMLQQDCNAKIWGWAKPGSQVTLRGSWSKQKSTVKADEEGRWDATIRTPKASYDTYTLTIQGDGETKTIQNILVGEVWFCSGQSNMEMPLGGFWNCPVEGSNEAIAQSGKYRRSIRVATVEHDGAQTPQKDVRCRWDECCPEKASAFSACGYFFARTLTDLLDVPVGIINCSWGGSCVEGWLPKEILLTYPDGLTPMDNTDYHAKMVMYNGMLYPLAGYTIKGFLWNQGESNVGKETEYIDRFQTMTRLWRKMWNQPGENLSMYTVELPPYWYDNNEADWGAKLREAQHIIAQQLEHSGCVCTTDLSYPWEQKQIHPTQKRQIGERLAYMAATRDYGMKGLQGESPEFQYLTIVDASKDDQAVVAGSSVSEQGVKTGKVLKLYFSNSVEGFDRMSDIPGFEAAGADGVFHPAIVWASSEWQNSKYQGCFLKLACPEVSDICEIRYAFHNYSPGTLHNSRGLPVVPFRARVNKYVSVHDGKFWIGDKEYRYVGANFWYGAILASEGQGGDRERLAKELDLLKQVGINNIRVLVGGDGHADPEYQIRPTLQTEPGVYNDTILRGLDYLMNELEKRDMKVVLYLNNAWEWSGGFGQYLYWAGAGPVASPKDWDAFQKYHCQFTQNQKATEMAANHTRFIVSRTNTITGKPYSESPALMAWELANEPRAFASDTKTKECFAQWIQDQAKLIKSIDPNHLVTTGSEGKYGCQVDMNLYTKIHSYPEIDYACIHIWPFNWAWLGKYVATTQEAIDTNGPKSVMDSVQVACKNTADYIDEHYAPMHAAGKPLVLEEFGYPRDNYSVKQGTPTTARDTYYKYVFSIIRDSGKIAGCNFWSWGGLADVRHPKWQKWDPYTGDPAQEEQGLNSVFSGDESTMQIIREMTKDITK